MNKRRKRRKIRYFRIGAAVFLLVLIIFGIVLASSACRKESADDTVQTDVNTIMSVTETSGVSPSEIISESTGETAASFVVYPDKTEESVKFSDEYDAKYALLVDIDENKVIAYKNENIRMYPASLTKVMTLIVAVENISNLSDTVVITDEIVNQMIYQNASRAGFFPGETPTLKDVLYGMILPSGGDASLAAAEYVSGSEEAFVELMNDKAKEMGLKNTHFTNVVGLHDEKHYSTATDMALILEYAIQNDICREILSCYEYAIEPTVQNPEGLLLTSDLFSRMYGDEMPDVLIKGGKTGFTDEAGNCIESFAEVNGKKYILVLCGGTTNWNNIYNTLSAYSVYCADGKPYEPPSVY